MGCFLYEAVRARFGVAPDDDRQQLSVRALCQLICAAWARPCWNPLEARGCGIQNFSEARRASTGPGRPHEGAMAGWQSHSFSWAPCRSLPRFLRAACFSYRALSNLGERNPKRALERSKSLHKEAIISTWNKPSSCQATPPGPPCRSSRLSGAQVMTEPATGRFRGYKIMQNTVDFGGILPP